MRRRMFVRWGVLFVAFGAIAACGWFDDPSPEEARVRLDGTPGETVDILLSTEFISGVSSDGVTQVEIFDSETLTRALPFDTTIGIASQQRFFVRVIDADTVASQVRMQVFIDNDSKYDQERFVNLRQLLFLFTFNQPITGVVELI